MPSPTTVNDVLQELKGLGYTDSSKRWLEHYLAACTLALFVKDAQGPSRGKNQFANSAVGALQRAEFVGSEEAFLISKRFWITLATLSRPQPAQPLSLRP
jgi:hypothetical protein